MAVAGRFANWELSRPGSGGQSECAGMRSNGKWLDGACSKGAPYVCEQSP
jgi:hypothetical protein